MGLQDRDYLRARQRGEYDNPKLFSPPEPSTKLTLWIILFWVAVIFACFKGWSWWELRQAPPAAAKATVVPTPAAVLKAYPNLTGNWNPNKPAPPYSPSLPSTVQTFTKCIGSGVTSYTDGKCDPSAKSSRVTVNPGENLSDGLRPAIPDRTRSAVAPPQVVQAGPAAEPSRNPHLEKKLLCDQYEAEIKRIDTMARQPLAGSEQDRLATQRKKARDEQFRIRC